MNKLFDEAICLCLDKRQAEWTQLAEDFEKRFGQPMQKCIAGAGEIFPKEYYNHIDVKPEQVDLRYWGYGRADLKIHHYNAFLCHKKMLTYAKQKGLKRVLFLEDDSYFTDRYEKVINLLPKIDFNLLYLGWWIGATNPDIEEAYKTIGQCGIANVDTLGGLHGVIIDETMYDYMLTLPPINPIDSQLNLIHSRIQSYYVYPKLIHVKSIFSNCEQCTIEREHL